MCKKWTILLCGIWLYQLFSKTVYSYEQLEKRPITADENQLKDSTSGQEIEKTHFIKSKIPQKLLASHTAKQSDNPKNSV